MVPMGRSGTSGRAGRIRPAGDRDEGRQPGRRRFWFDPRFVLGLVLVAGSVAGVGAIVAGADRSVTVYAARHSLAVGDVIDTADLVATGVRFPDATALYLTPERMPDDGLIVTRTISAGELVAAAATGTRAGESVTSVVVDVRGTLPDAVAPGAVVDVWAARQEERGAFGPPAVIVGEVTVVRIVEARSLITDGGSSAVELRVPKAKVAAVLQSVANDDAVALVPVHGRLGDGP